MKEIQNTYSEDFEVRSFENDFRQKLRLTTLFQYFQEVAGRHVAETLIGYEALKEAGLFWVLVRIKVKVHRMPDWQESVSLTTWAKKIDKMFAYRECEASNDTGLLASISSEWMLMNQDSRKPARLAVLTAAFPITFKDALSETLIKLKPFGRLTLTETRRASYSDIDMHSHLNNTKYIEWALDCIDFDIYEHKEIDELQVNFIAEVGSWDEIEILKYEGDDNRYYFEGFNKTKDIKAFQLELKLKQLDSKIEVNHV